MRKGMQFALIDGETLIKIAETVSVSKGGSGVVSLMPADAAATLLVGLRFTPDHSLRYSNLPAEVMERTVDEPVFIEADFRFSRTDRPHSEMRLALEYRGGEDLSVLPISGTQQFGVGAGDCFR